MSNLTRKFSRTPIIEARSAEDEFDRIMDAMGREQYAAFLRFPTKIQEWIMLAAQPMNCVELLRVYETGAFTDDQVIDVIKYRMQRADGPAWTAPRGIGRAQ